ncbi:hypothetical protein ACRN9T_06005 [Shewanella baltica]|uniref:hypothetical protein n=1 Tax=Shewanella baltica TaxID=62322 RepID=UPI003D79E198
MTSVNWGLLGPEMLASERRTRTLGVGATVRAFNDLAVPSLGGVKYSKSIFLACLGIYVAEKSRETGAQVSNIQVTNAIEALASCLSYRMNGWQSDPRLQGNTKLRGKEDLSFKIVSQHNFYVTQPMRMATVQTLPGLGLVEGKGERFNSYCLSVHGVDLVRAGCEGFKCHSNGIADFLVKWVLGDARNPNQLGLLQAISPLEELAQGAKGIIKERLVSGNDDNAKRRRNALTWVGNIAETPCVNWKKPNELTDEHFKDIQSGAYFFMLRDKIMQLLDVVETDVANAKSGKLVMSEGFSINVVKSLSNVKSAADQFISVQHDPSPEKLATLLAKECLQASDAQIILSLVDRDNVVLKVRDKEIVKGPAFGGTQAELEEEYQGVSLFPAGVSYRLWNLHVLNLDFNGQLELWLNKKESV